MFENTGAVGQLIAGRYELRQLVGRGGMGCVWRAEHLTLHTPVAIKLLLGDAGPASLARFSREAQAAASLRSPCIVQILDHGVDQGVAYIAMEYLEGETLAARLAQRGQLTPAETASILTGVVRGMARAHRAGVVHRDLKPDNVFLARDEESGGEIVKVLDFGIAKLVERPAAANDASTHTGVMLGTPCYMSPEQARGRKDLDARTDLWSFGVIAFECLVGRRPFVAEALGELMLLICVEPVPRPSAIAPVPPGFDDWFARAMERDPAARFQNVRDLAAGLAEVLTPGVAWLDPTGGSESESRDPAPRIGLDPTEAAPGPSTGEVVSRSLAAPAESQRSVRTGARVALYGILAVAAAGAAVLGVSRVRAPGGEKVEAVSASASASASPAPASAPASASAPAPAPAPAPASVPAPAPVPVPRTRVPVPRFAPSSLPAPCRVETWTDDTGETHARRVCP